MVVGVEPAKDPRAFQPAPPRDVHAPMQVFIQNVIRDQGKQSTREGRPAKKIRGDEQQRRLHEQECRRVPPRERDFFEIVLALDVIGIIGAKQSVMRERVGGERVVPDCASHIYAAPIRKNLHTRKTRKNFHRKPKE